MKRLSFIKLKKKIILANNRRKLKQKSFTIISDNCWGATIYEKYGLAYQSPTVGLFILGHDFVKLCANWEEYFEKTLRFIPWQEGRYYQEWKDKYKEPFPIARLGDIEIYFLHYASEEEAFEKWERRKKRIDVNHMLFKISERNCSKEEAEEFMRLPLKNKVCFAYDDILGSINVPELKDFHGDEIPILKKYFNELSVLNKL